MDFILQNRFAFIFVLTRVSMIVTFGVLFNDKRISKMFKFGLIFFISVIATPIVSTENMKDIHNILFITLLINEILIGFTIGFISNLVTHTITMAGSLIDTQAGFGMAQTFDPTTQSQVSIISQLMLLVSSFCFLLNDFHITFLEILLDSFRYMPIGTTITVTKIIPIITSCIAVAVCIALPVIGVIFLIDVVLGISAKTMPQLNIFSIGFIVKIAVAMILMYSYIISLNGIIKMISKFLFANIQKIF